MMEGKTINKGGCGKIVETIYKGKPAIRKKILIKYGKDAQLKDKFVTLSRLVLNKQQQLGTMTKNEILFKKKMQKKEQKIMKELKKYDNIAQIYEFDDEKCEIIMKKYIGSIKKLKKELNFRQKCEIIYDIVNGLQSIHDLGLIHSDLKCANVLFEYDNLEERFKGYITDFGGTSKIGNTLTVYTQEFWPKKYNDRLSKENDIYSLGKTILEFIANDNIFFLEKINYNNFPEEVSLEEFDYNKELYELVRKSLRQKPEERPKLDEYFNVLENIIYDF